MSLELKFSLAQVSDGDSKWQVNLRSRKRRVSLNLVVEERIDVNFVEGLGRYIGNSVCVVSAFVTSVLMGSFRA